MAKIRINGELLEFDQSRKPMSEAIAVENALNMRYGDWERDLAAGSMRAMCGFIWLVWRRNGRDVPIAGILDGTVEIDLGELLDGLLEAQQEQDPADG